MSTLERRRRVRCRLACELLGAQRTPLRSHIVTLSEGGFAVETEPRFETGDEMRICILPHRRERAVKVRSILELAGGLAAARTAARAAEITAHEAALVLEADAADCRLPDPAEATLDDPRHDLGADHPDGESGDRYLTAAVTGRPSP